MPRFDSDDRLALSVTDTAGTTKRWGGDEPNAEDIPSGLEFETTIPGGFKTLSNSLLRRIDLDYPDLGVLDEIRCYGPGNETAWEGRHQAIPRQTGGNSYGVAPSAVGWAAHLRDDETFREIYVDRDWSSWGDPSLSRKLAMLGSFTVGGPSVIPDDTSQPALMLEATDTWLSTSKPSIEALYDARHIPLASLYYAWKKGATINEADSNWSWAADLSDDDTYTAYDTTSSLRAVGPGTGTLAATTTSRRFAHVGLYYGAAAGGDGARFPLLWTCLAVYGRHGLTKRGTENATTAKGFYASDIIRDVVARAAPKLTANGIQDTTFVIPQAVFFDPTTAEDVVLSVNKHHLWNWGVYDDRDFFYRPWDPASGTTWEARIADGAQLSLDGDDAATVYNGVVVSFSDPAGRRRLVGPPGYPCDQSDGALVNVSETNPANAHGYDRKWGRLDISGVTTIAAAIQIGAIWLAEKSLPQRRGSITLIGDAFDRARGWRPGWAVRAGDHICVTDGAYTGPRRITNTRYNRDGRSISCALDNSAYKLDAILERMGVALLGVV